MTSTRTDAPSLVASTTAIDGRHLDLLREAGPDGLVFTHEGSGLAGRGVALRVAPDDVAEVLASITDDDEVRAPGSGPVAMGALPFDPSRPGGTLVIPQTIVGRRPDGTAWRTMITRPGSPHAAVAPRPPPSPPGGRPPDGFTLTSTRSHEEWCAVVAAAVSVIRHGDLDKVVLAREVVVEANRPILPADVLERLRALHPSCYVFSIDGFLGASPELLIARSGAEIRSHPLAGTIPRSGDPGNDARASAQLLASAKDRHEHRLVVDAVAATLRPWCDRLDVPTEPSIVPLRNVSHLGTHVRGRLASAEAVATALDLARALHPTPAVGGSPTRAALRWLSANEGLDRARYAGPVGWVDSRGDGEFAVGIRSAEVNGTRARLIAGVGVVADSDPDAELAETQLKLQALLAAIVRP